MKRETGIPSEDKGLSAEELDEQDAAALPEREEMSVFTGIHPLPPMPVSDPLPVADPSA